MDVTAVIRKAGRKFGDSANVVIDQADFFDFINEAQMAIVRDTGCLTKIASAAASTYPVTLPVDFLRAARVAYGVEALDFITLDELDSKKVDTAYNDRPFFYYFANNALNLWPDPASTDTTQVHFTYIYAPTEIASTATPLSIPVGFHEDLVNKVIACCHERVENWNAAEKYNTTFLQGLGQRKEDAALADDGFPVIRDDPHEDW